MKTVNVHEAKSTLSALLALVDQGEEIVIARNGEPVTKPTRYRPSQTRQSGMWRRLPGWEGFRYDPTAFAPMTAQEIADDGWMCARASSPTPARSSRSSPTTPPR